MSGGKKREVCMWCMKCEDSIILFCLWAQHYGDSDEWDRAKA